MSRINSRLKELEDICKRNVEARFHAQREARAWKYVALFFFVMFVMMIFISEARAAELRVLVGSLHHPEAADCEFNPGVGVAEDGWLFMAYRNSHCDSAALVAHGWHVGPIILAAGGAVGYSDPIQPFAAIEYHPDPLFFGLIPGGLFEGESILFFGARIQL